VSLEKAAAGPWQLFRDTPFPRLQLLAGGSPAERLQALDSVDCDILVVPGGLGDIKQGVERLARLGTSVIYVPGIEEYRGRDVVDVIGDSCTAARDTDVHVLDRRSIVLDGVRFLGATLWSSPGDCSENPQEWFSQARDKFREIRSELWWIDASNAEHAAALCVANGWAMPFRQVHKSVRGMHPVVSLVENQRALAWLSQELMKEFRGPTVVVTHFEPTPCGRRHAEGHRKATTRTELLLKQHRYAADLWLHGHSDCITDTVIEGVRVYGGFPTQRSHQGALRRGEVTSPQIRIDRGLISPLSLIVEPLVAEMRRIEANVRAILPHTMAQSATLRRCVCRTIHSELQLFRQRADAAYLLERELNPPDSNIEAAAMSARAAYEAPLGYPSKDGREARFDYYGLVQRMSQHTEWLSELPYQALSILGRWGMRAYDILRNLEERGVHACVVGPSVQALRFAKLADVIEVKLRVSEHEFMNESATLRRLSVHSTDWPFTVRLSRVDALCESKGRLLTLPQIKRFVSCISGNAIMS
jgi:hypothetical protein